MSTPQNRLTPAPVRQDAICMCATGRACSSFAAGHAVHLVQARLVSATATQWLDAIVTRADDDGVIDIVTLDGDAIELWNGAGASSRVRAGSPVAFHPRYHALHADGRLFNALAL